MHGPCGTPERQPGSPDQLFATPAVVSLTILAVGFGGFALGIDWAWIAFPVGYGGVLPYITRRNRVTRESNSDSPNPPDQGGDDNEERLDDVRARYVDGAIDERTLERELEDALDGDPERH